MKEDTSEEHMSCQRLTSYHYPIREQPCQHPNFTLLSREGAAARPQITGGGKRDINKDQSLDSQSHTRRLMQTGVCVLGLFSETLERSSSRRGMLIVNTAVRRQAEEEDVLSTALLSVCRQP